jgi:hypothetical protein
MFHDSVADPCDRQRGSIHAVPILPLIGDTGTLAAVDELKAVLGHRSPKPLHFLPRGFVAFTRA